MDRLGDWSLALVSALTQSRVSTVVVSPGSRSTPLLWAAHRLASQGTLELVSVIDEREAAFFALGVAKGSAGCAMLLCTSGSALAHYAPAVLEASESFTPLVVVSADRPTRLLGTGANQTTDQRAFFGGHVRAYAAAEGPDPHAPGSPAEGHRLAALGERVARLVEAAVTPVPGPVHLNVHLAKPLEPDEDALPACSELSPPVVSSPSSASAAASVHGDGVLTAVATTPAHGLDSAALRQRLVEAERAIVVAGPWVDRHPVGVDPALQAKAYRQTLFAVCRAYGLTLLPETTSCCRFGEEREAVGVTVVDHFDPLLQAGALDGEWAPDVVLQLGGLPASRGFNRAAGTWRNTFRVAVHPYRPPDPWGGATRVQLHPSAFLELLLNDAPAEAKPNPYGGVLAALDERMAQAAEALSTFAGEGEAPVSEPGAVRRVLACLPVDATLVLGNSLPVRTADRWVAGGARPIQVLSQRGLSGIDGLLSGALGAAFGADTEGERGPTVLLLGDISALHGLAGLMTAAVRPAGSAGAQPPRVVVVLNNHGGRIFEQLPAARLRAFDASGAWTTPHSLSFEHAAAFYGVNYACVTGEEELTEALKRALGGQGVTLLEVDLAPHDIAARDRRLAEEAAACSAALQATPLPVPE